MVLYNCNYVCLYSLNCVVQETAKEISGRVDRAPAAETLEKFPPLSPGRANSADRL